MSGDSIVRNSLPFDEEWVKECKPINLPAILHYAGNLKQHRKLAGIHKIAWLVNALQCLDLTTLAGDDTLTNVKRLCNKAIFPLNGDLLQSLGFKELTVGAVCVYPSRVADCKAVLSGLPYSVPIASVATGFPAGQTKLSTRLEEIRGAIKDGATEIDIVINRSLALAGDWKGVYDEVSTMREACGSAAHLKTILATGELGSLDNVYKASLVCMMAGADFIKTSTGKENVNAILPVGVVMTRAIYDFYKKTGIKVGIKPAGGLRTTDDALSWQILVREQLGPEWLVPSLFRIGASSLLGSIEMELFRLLKGVPLDSHQICLA